MSTAMQHALEGVITVMFVGLVLRYGTQFAQVVNGTGQSYIVLVRGLQGRQV